MLYNDKKFIGKTLQAIRKNAGIKQSELAEKIGISEKHLSKIETGKNFPSLDNFFKMAEVLRFNLSEFGLEVDVKLDKYKQALLKLVYSASEGEARSYLEILETLNRILNSKF